MAKDILSEVQKTFDDMAMLLSQIYRLRSKVSEGKDMSNHRRFNPKKPSRNPTNIALLEELVTCNQRLTLAEMEEKTGIPNATIHTILSEDFRMTEKSAHWVPRLLTDDQMKERKESSEEFVEMTPAEPEDFLRKIVTMDMSMVCFHTPETKNQSKQWLPVAIKART